MLEVIRASRRHALSAALIFFVSSNAANGQTTAFTYQGQLSDGGEVAGGSYDLRFTLFDTTAGGAQISTPQTVSAVPVSGGVFTVQLDFGVNAFPGANRFLEIGVKPAAAGGSYTTLAPRQQISSSPYAIRTLSAATADALSSACVGCVQSAQINSVAGSKISGTVPAASVPTGSGNYIQNTTAQQTNANFNVSGNGVVGGNLTVAGTLNANVGGTVIQNRTTPQANANFNISGNGTVGGVLSASKVEIAAQDGLRISGSQPFLTLRDTNAAGKRGVVSSSSGDVGFYTDSAVGIAPTMLIKNMSGNVGIGNGAPSHRLTITGGPPWTSYSWGGALALDNAAAIGWFPNNSAHSFGIGQTNGGLYFFRTSSAPGTTGSVANYDLFISDSGVVGAGAIDPNSHIGRLQIDGGSDYGGVYGRTSSASDGKAGVYGEGPIGVYGKSDGQPTSYGVWSEGDMIAHEGTVFANDFMNISDRNAKANFSSVEPAAILHKLVSIPIQTWNFQSQPDAVRHLGPMAQDFHAAFDLGTDDKHISTLDANGVALAAIQGLYQMVQEKDLQLQQLQLRVQQLEQKFQTD